MKTAPAVSQQRRFNGGLVSVLALCVLFGVLLLGDFSATTSQTASGLGLLTGGVLVIVSCGLATRHSTGSRRRAWLLLTAAAAVALGGNIWVVAVGAHPVDSPSLVGETSIALALLLSIGGLLSFPALRHRGIELVRIALDGLVVGTAVLITTALLDYAEILHPRGATPVLQLTSVLFPLLDVVLATAAVLLVVRSRSDRAVLCLVGAGFLMYAVADLAFAVRAARGDFDFGTVVDLGWITGYLLIALAAWHPNATTTARTDGSTAGSDLQSTVMVVGVIATAVAAQASFGADRPLGRTQLVLWLLLVLATGARQILLTLDNAALRRGLERRVREQTADLSRLVRQTEVLLTSVGDGIYEVDSRGRVRFVNPSGADALGYASDELIGVRAHDQFHAPRADGTPFDWASCYITEAIEHGVTSVAEEDLYVRRDGSVIPVEITASPLVDGDHIGGAVVVFRDMTQRREVDRMKNEFLSVVSHELRTPLTSIRGSLGLLAGGRLMELPPQAERMLTIALESSERLTRLINDILDIERLEAGSLPVDVRPREAADLVNASVLELRGLAVSKDVTLEVGASSGRVLADTDRIVQTLANLLGNAIKFSQPGGVVRVEAVPESDLVTFTVRDQGRGIPSEKLERIFERFEQVDSSDARHMGGTGLGLAISRGIVERHGGRIWAESTLGEGTAVHFTLLTCEEQSVDTVIEREAEPEHDHA